MAENCDQHFSCCGHAILASTGVNTLATMFPSSGSREVQLPRSRRQARVLRSPSRSRTHGSQRQCGPLLSKGRAGADNLLIARNSATVLVTALQCLSLRIEPRPVHVFASCCLRSSCRRQARSMPQGRRGRILLSLPEGVPVAQTHEISSPTLQDCVPHQLLTSVICGESEGPRTELGIQILQVARCSSC